MKPRAVVGVLVTACLGAALVLLHDRVLAAVGGMLPPGLMAMVLRALEAVLVGAAVWLSAGPLLTLVRAGLARWDTFFEKRMASVPPERARLVGSLLITVALGVVIAGAAEGQRVFTALERQVVDLWFRQLFPANSQAVRALDSHPAGHVRPDIVLVTIDNETVRRMGWPFPRHYYASFLDVMTEGGAASVSFDVLLVDENKDHPEWDVLVGEAARRNGRAVLGYSISPRARDPSATRVALQDALIKGHTFPLSQVHGSLTDFSIVEGADSEPDPVIAAIAPHVMQAATNIKLDTGDEVLRHGMLLFRLGDRVFPSLTLRAAVLGLGLTLQDVQVYPGSHIDLGGRVRLPLDDLGRTLVRYQGSPGTFPQIPLHRVILKQVSFTLPGNPMGEDLALLLGPETQLTVDGKPVPVDALDLALVQRGKRVQGKASTATDPARVLQLALFTTPPSGEPAYEMLDEATLSFDDVVSALKVKRADPADFKGKHVVLGSTATAASDQRHTPVGLMPGMEHHATLLNNVLEQQGMVHSSVPFNLALILVLSLLVGFLVARLKVATGVLATAVLLFVVMAGAYRAFTAGTVVPVVGPALTLTLGYVLAVLNILRREQRDRSRAEESREFIRRTFGRYLTDQVVDTLLNSSDGLKLGGDRRKVTIMMTDLRGFTSMSTQLEPEKVVAILNNYLGIMTDIVVRYGGTIDEFIGDAILVVFGAPVQRPDDAVRGVACAIEMLNAMEQVNAWSVSNGLPPVEMGIGMNTGECVVGNIGSEKRAKYGIVGTPINMCARVEGFTVGGQLMISDTVRTECGDALTIRDTMSVMAKGIANPIIIHDVTGVRAPHPVSLPVAAEDLRPLSSPFPLRLNILIGKSSSDETYETQVLALSDQGMHIKSPKLMDALTNLKFWIYSDDGKLMDGDLYGKVTRPAVEPGVCYIRFTSIPDALKPEMAARWQAARHEENTSVAAPLASAH